MNEIDNKYLVIKKIIIQMVIILEIMHKNGVIHRDLKVWVLSIFSPLISCLTKMVL
jgi:serine/threonine protein kinase